MTDQNDRAAERGGAEIAARLDRAAAGLIGLVWPVLLVPSPRVTDAILVLATLLLGMAAGLDARGQGRSIASILIGPVARLFRSAPWAFAALVMLALLGLASSLWSVAPQFTLERAGQFAGIVVVSLLFLSFAPRLAKTAVLEWLAIGLVLGVALIVIDRIAGHPILTLVGLPADLIEYNRAVLQYGLLAFPVLLVASWKPPLALASFLVVLAAVFLSPNEAAKLGCLCGLIVLMIARPNVHIARLMVTAGFVFSVLALPFLIGAASAMLNDLPFIPPQPASVIVRVAVWSDIQSRLMETLPLGIGLEATRHTAPMPPIIHQGITLVEARAPFHPHSLPLQVLYELGFAASALVLIIGLGALRWCVRQQRGIADVGLAGFAAMFGAFLVANSAWPSWRIALMALIAGLVLAGRNRLADEGDLG